MLPKVVFCGDPKLFTTTTHGMTRFEIINPYKFFITTIALAKSYVSVCIKKLSGFKYGQMSVFISNLNMVKTTFVETFHISPHKVEFNLIYSRRLNLSSAKC